METYIAEANFAAWQMQATVNTPASAGLALGRTPASRTRYSPADFKTPGSQRQPRGSMQSPGESAGGGTPSMSVPRVRTSSKARPSRLRPGNPATPTAQQVHPALYSCHACCLPPSIYVLESDPMSGPTVAACTRSDQSRFWAGIFLVWYPLFRLQGSP